MNQRVYDPMVLPSGSYNPQVPRIPRVPSYLHGPRWNQPMYETERHQRVYEPIVLSIGPYHHGKRQFRKTEEFKDWVLHEFISKSQDEDARKDRDYFYWSIMEVINEIRSDYEGIEEFNDEALATIILRDMCFLVSFMQIPANQFLVMMMNRRLGCSTAKLVRRDCLVLENQIPFWIINRILYLRYGKDEGDRVVYKYLSVWFFPDPSQLRRLPWEDQEQPRHLLEAARMAIILKQEATSETTTETKPHFLTKIFKCKKIWKASSPQYLVSVRRTPYRSITYLQEKGIYFEPRSYFFGDVRFTSHSCHGMLQLPILWINDDSVEFLSSLITFELVLRGSEGDTDVTDCVNFVKSLIETPNDARVLQERGILYSTLGSDEEIVKAFKDINTHGFNDFGIFGEVKMKIDEHCNNKAKTWMSDFFHNYFRSPWNVIALFAATFILCLTFIQTFFTIRPAH